MHMPRGQITGIPPARWRTPSSRAPKDRRRSSLARLQADAVVIKAHPRAGQLQVRDRRSPRIDFWPDTGVWAIRGDSRHQRGLRKLLDFLHHN